MVLTAEQEEEQARTERVKLLACVFVDDMQHDAELAVAIAREMIARMPLPMRKTLLRRAAADMLRVERETRHPLLEMKIRDQWIME